MSAPTRTARRSRRGALCLVAALALAGGAAGCGVEAGSDLSATGTGGLAATGTDGAAATTSTVVLEEGSFEGTGGAVFLRDAAEATSEVTTQKMKMVMTTSGMPVMGDMEITYEGAFDNESGRGHMTVDMGDLMGVLGEGAETMEMVIDGDTIYVKSAIFSSLGDGKPWVRMTEEGLSDSTTGMGVQGDPTGFLDFLEGAGDEVETVRREDLRGVPTTHVRTEIDMVELMESASEEDRAQFEEDLEGLGGAAEAFGAVPVEAWVDDNGYVRRFLMTFDMSGIMEEAGEIGGELTMSMDIELYDFNEPVDVRIPDPSEVGEMDPSLTPGD